jgi:FkbM family methyltransferase
MLNFLKSARENYYASTVLTAVARPIHFACFHLSRQIELKVKKNGAAIPLPNGAVLRIGRDAGISLASLLFWKGFDAYEPQTSHVLRFFFERVTTFVDVGANYGLYSLLGALWNPGLQVVAFEPVPEIYDALMRNIALNHVGKQISAHKLALADTSGPATFYLPTSQNRDCETTGTLASDSWQSRKRSPQIRVETVRFDDFEHANPMKVELMKIDVEDFEAGVLRGMERTIRRDRPFIVCEILPRAHGNVDTMRIVDSLGYTPYWITRLGCIRVSRFDFECRFSCDFLLSPVSPPGEVITDLASFWTLRQSSILLERTSIA